MFCILSQVVPVPFFTAVCASPCFSKTATKRRPPLRIDLSYMVTAWTAAAGNMTFPLATPLNHSRASS